MHTSKNDEIAESASRTIVFFTTAHFSSTLHAVIVWNKLIRYILQVLLKVMKRAIAGVGLGTMKFDQSEQIQSHTGETTQLCGFTRVMYFFTNFVSYLHYYS